MADIKAELLRSLIEQGYPISTVADIDLTPAEVADLQAKHAARITAREYQPGDLGEVDPWETIPPSLQAEYQQWQDRLARGELTSKLVRMSDGKIHYIRPYYMDAVKKAGGKPYVIIEDGAIRLFQWHRADRPGYHAVKPAELASVAEAHRQQRITDAVLIEALTLVKQRLHARGIKPLVGGP